MHKFRFHWLTGYIEEGEGYDVADAFRRLGYGGDAIRALDWYEQIDLSEDVSAGGACDG